MENKAVFFSANWCPSCPTMKTRFEKVATRVGVKPSYVNVDTDPDLAIDFNIKGVPTIVIVNKNQEVVASYAGQRSESELISILNEFCI